MANKIVQLTNQDGDNLYPIASVPHGASITMTNVDPGEGSALAADNYVGVYGANPMIMDYSTSEVNTGAKWIDGSDIYKKTVYLGYLPNATTKNVAHGVTNFGVPIKLEGMALTEAGTGHPINISRPTNLALEIGAYVDGTNIVVMTGTDRSSWTGYATIYYTKSS